MPCIVTATSDPARGLPRPGRGIWEPRPEQDYTLSAADCAELASETTYWVCDEHDEISPFDEWLVPALRDGNKC